MVYLTPDDYRNQTKTSTRYAKKTKLPTEFKTKPHQCSQCTRTDATRHHISGKEYRWLCERCRLRHTNKNATEKPNFVKASKLYRNK